MFDDVILATTREFLKSDGTLIALIGRLEDIEISREGRPNPVCGNRFLGLHMSSTTNLNPKQMAGIKMEYDIELILSRKIEARPKDNDRAYMYEDGGALPKIEVRIVRLLHQSVPLRNAIKAALDQENSYPDLHVDFDGGIEYHGPRGGVVFRDADWFFADAETPMADQLRKRQAANPYAVTQKDKGPEKSREYFGISKAFLFRLRLYVAHRHLRVSPS